MATATYASQALRQPQTKLAPFTGFVRDLAEDVRTTGAQMAGEMHTDLFHKHLLKLACCYFALIVILLSGMVPFLYLVN